jgi:hypothetical protein
MGMRHSGPPRHPLCRLAVADNGAVSEENLERARQGYEVLNRGEIERFLTEFGHPDYEFHPGVQVPSIPSVVRGRDGLRAWIQQWYEEPWEGQLLMDVEHRGTR